VQIPRFPESKHPLVKSLSYESDRSLFQLFQLYPEQGKYFTTIYCRYSNLIYTLIAHGTESQVQGDYLFALTWKYIFYEMGELELSEEGELESDSRQSWLMDLTGLCLNQMELPPVEEIKYHLKAAPPPLWCYLEQGLESLEPLVRLIVVLVDKFYWSEERIAAYLPVEGVIVSEADVERLLFEGRQMLEKSLPEDIRAIYLRRV